MSGVVVVPGSWTEKELRFQAENVATQLGNNNGFNCNAIKVLIMHDTWPQKREFLDMLQVCSRNTPTQTGLLPGRRAAI